MHKLTSKVTDLDAARGWKPAAERRWGTAVYQQDCHDITCPPALPQECRIAMSGSFLAACFRQDSIFLRWLSLANHFYMSV